MFTRYYLGDYEEEYDDLGYIRQIHYLSGAIMIITISPWSDYEEHLYYSNTDYQGSLIALTDESGNVVERYAYNPWGARRNPDNWTWSDSRTSWIVNRGYTGHEHLDAFGIINMNGRVYDPMTAVFFSPDPFVYDANNWLSYNRYSYVLNNPFRYTDPNGEFPWLLAAGLFLVLTEPGYEIQKFFSPIAIHVKSGFGSRNFVGIETSLGMPQMFKGYRYEYGASYYLNDIDHSYSGWETQKGKEWSSGYKGYFYKFQHTSYNRKGEKYDQDRDKITYGVIPGLVSAEFENDADMHGVFDLPGFPEHKHSDKYQTASVKLNFLGLQTGLLLFTGNPDGAIVGYDINGNEIYVQNENSPLATDVDDYRAGIFYLAFGPLKYGINSEGIRNATQNILHRINGWPEFRIINTPASFYWEFGW